MKIKTSELTGAALDWAVSKADNPPGKEGGMDWWERDDKGYLFDPLNECTYSPSADWAQGGTILEMEKIDLYYSTEQALWAAAIWKDVQGGGQLEHKQTGCSTPLIAAMRCFVVSRLGDTVEVPDELA